MLDELTINNKLFFMTGDLALSYLENAVCLFFNKEMWGNYNLDDPYALVKNGDWTIDKIMDITKQVSADLDNDGKYTDKDLYGYVTDCHNFVDAYQQALEAPVTVMGDDGLHATCRAGRKIHQRLF